MFVLVSGITCIPKKQRYKYYKLRIYPFLEIKLKSFLKWLTKLSGISCWCLASGKPQTAVCSFALPRFQIFAFSSVQFSSFLFRQSIIQYKNTYRNYKVAREPRISQKAFEASAHQSQRSKQNKMKFAE